MQTLTSSLLLPRMRVLDNTSVDADAPDKNFGLTQAAFERLVEQLKAGDETLFERLFVNHFEKCTAYLRSECYASEQDAYDVTLDTMVFFRQSLLQGKTKYGNLRYLFTRMAKCAYLEWIKHRKRLPFVELLSQDAEQADFGEGNYSEDMFQALEKAWAQICEDCQLVLRKQIIEKLDQKTIAEQLKMTVANVAQTKLRCLNKFRENFFAVYEY